MSEQSARGHWSGSLAFVMAASGSAVGLGNLWKFPYIAWQNQGGAFVLVYLACVLLVGAPLMMAEILLGRRVQANPVVAFEKLGNRGWSLVGWLGVLAGIVILSFYAVIAGWSLTSFVQCLGWSWNGYQSPPSETFGAFLANGWLQVGLGFVFLVSTGLIVGRGISTGIEKATRVMMPILLGIILYLVVNVSLLDGFGKALAFIFTPDFGTLTSHAVLEALGHSFFTLSLGMGAMVTYGSYMRKEDSIVKASAAIVFLDTLIALFACVIMYSIIFSVPSVAASMAERKSTVGMLFVTMPELIYTQIPGGVLVGPIFYVLVAFAALSSTISLLEVTVSLMVDKLGVHRVKATIFSTTGIFLLSIACALSLGANDFLSNWKPFGHAEEGLFWRLNQIVAANKAGVLSVFDHVAANWLLPLGGLFLSLFVGWVVSREAAQEELGMQDAAGNPSAAFRVWRFLVRFLAPAAILWIVFEVLRGGDFS